MCLLSAGEYELEKSRGGEAVLAASVEINVYSAIN